MTTKKTRDAISMTSKKTRDAIRNEFLPRDAIRMQPSRLYCRYISQILQYNQNINDNYSLYIKRM
jgi:hypothetical protein